MKLKLLVDAGAMKPNPAISQKLGPLGINLGRVIAEVNKATEKYKGMKVPVILDIDVKTKNFTITPLTPPTTELLKKEVNAEKGSPMPNKVKIGNLAIEQIVKIAKMKKEDMMASSLKKAVKTVLASCISLGILVESKEPKQVIEEVDQGVYDEIIEKGIEKPEEEKLKKLASDFEAVKKAQESLVKEIEKKAEKAAEEKSA
ncbi:MAG TPA: 50S ribosomal protein L11 [Candidatus Pacearchaeota archaeon]|nr:50S ribosomal protein L11 [Candidatus Pacearchaeota archaeon]